MRIEQRLRLIRRLKAELEQCDKILHGEKVVHVMRLDANGNRVYETLLMPLSPRDEGETRTRVRELCKALQLLKT